LRQPLTRAIPRPYRETTPVIVASIPVNQYLPF